MSNTPKGISKITEQIDENISAEIYKLKEETLLKIDLVLNNSLETIGEIYKTKFTNNLDFTRDDHMYKEINPEFRNLGYGKQLIDLWLKHGGVLPKLEHDNTPSGVLLLIKSGYKLIGYFEKKGTNNEFYTVDDENKEVEKLKNNLDKERVNIIYMLKKQAA